MRRTGWGRVERMSREKVLARTDKRAPFLGEDFDKRLAALKPLRVVFPDAGFVSDSMKINVEQVFKLLGH